MNCKLWISSLIFLLLLAWPFCHLGSDIHIPFGGKQFSIKSIGGSRVGNSKFVICVVTQDIEQTGQVRTSFPALRGCGDRGVYMHVLQHGAAVPCSPAELVVQGVLGVSPGARPLCVSDVPEVAL